MRTRFPTTGEVKITGTNNPELIVSVYLNIYSAVFRAISKFIYVA